MYMRKWAKLLVLPAIAGAGLVAWWSVGAQAMPPHPDLLKSDNPEIKAAVALYKSARADNRARGIDQPDPVAAGITATGSLRPLVVLVRFSDNDSSVAATYFDSLMFNHTSQSVWDYFDEVSYGAFSLDPGDLPSAIGWQLAPQLYSYYVDGQQGMGAYPNNSQKLVEDIIDQIDGDVDFSNYDANNDGYVDGIVVIHAGTGAERSGSSDDFWSHKWSIFPPQVRDGKTISTYSIQPEFWEDPGDMTIGVFCHELGHLLFGLEDMYDRDGDSRGLGMWSVMATGSWCGPGFNGKYPSHPDAWTRIQMGLAIPVVIDEAIDNQSIPAVEDSATIFKLWTDGASIGDEYYLVENRHKTGYDAYMPGAGLCIYHIDEAVATGNDCQWYPGYTSNGHYLVALEQADSLWELEKNVLYDYGDTGDPYPGSTDNRMFTSASTPSSDSYNGTITYVVIADISNSGAVMTADFQVSLGADVFSEEDEAIAGMFELSQNYPNPFNLSTVISYSLPGAGDVTVEVFDILGSKVRTLWSGYREPGTHRIAWNGSDTQGAAVSTGIYFYRVSALQQIKTGKMVLIK
jgi:immune inhibitor A